MTHAGFASTKFNLLPSRVASSDIPIDSLDVSHVTEFRDIFYSVQPERAYCFLSFRAAYEFGKRVSKICGFQIRIKTTGMNRKDRIIYKYVCCQRQGLPEHGWKPKDGHRKRKRDSVRCECRWGCRIVGVKRPSAPGTHTVMRIHGDSLSTSSPSHSPDGNHSQTNPEHHSLADDDTDMVWYWERSDKEIDHNHELELTSISRRTMNTTSPSTPRRDTSLTLPSAGASSMRPPPSDPCTAATAVPRTSLADGRWLAMDQIAAVATSHLSRYPATMSPTWRDPRTHRRPSDEGLRGLESIAAMAPQLSDRLLIPPLSEVATPSSSQASASPSPASYTDPSAHSYTRNQFVKGPSAPHNSMSSLSHRMLFPISIQNTSAPTTHWRSESLPASPSSLQGSPTMPFQSTLPPPPPPSSDRTQQHQHAHHGKNLSTRLPPLHSSGSDHGHTHVSRPPTPSDLPSLASSRSSSIGSHSVVSASGTPSTSKSMTKMISLKDLLKAADSASDHIESPHLPPPPPQRNHDSADQFTTDPSAHVEEESAQLARRIPSLKGIIDGPQT